MVADEIGKLADSTSANLKSINDMFNLSNDEINRVYGRLEVFVNSLNKMIEHIAEFSHRIDLVVELTEQDLALNRVARESLGHVTEESNNILNATSEQKLALDEIAKSIAVINGATQEIAKPIAKQLEERGDTPHALPISTIGELSGYDR